jgi:hypothetical protein
MPNLHAQQAGNKQRCMVGPNGARAQGNSGIDSWYELTLNVLLLLPQGLTVPGRATVAWFQPSEPQLFHHSRFPVFLLQEEQQGDPFYGFPEFGRFPGELHREDAMPTVFVPL